MPSFQISCVASCYFLWKHFGPWSWILGLEDIEALLQSVTGLEPEEEVEDEAVPEELCNVGAVLNEEAGKEEEGESEINVFSSTEQEQTVERTETETGQKS